MNSLDSLFDLLDHWRHLPDYQLERRADIFFAVYLPAFLSDRFKTPVNPLLVPEFPVRIGTIYPNIPSNKSFKIDYVAFAEDMSQVWLVELKTDSASRREKQNAYLIAARQSGLPDLIQGIVQIAQASTHKHKYCQLLRLLEKLSLLDIPIELDGALESKHWVSDVNKCLSRIEIKAPQPPIEICFLQPVAVSSDEIGFSDFADWLDSLDDEVAKRFSVSLREWAAVVAGKPIR